MKVTLKIERSIFGDETDACTLTKCKPFGHLLHGESFVFPAPITEFHFQSVLLSNEVVFLSFVPNSTCADFVHLLGQVFHLLFPRFESSEDVLKVCQLGGKACFLDEAIKMTIAQGHVFLCAVSACAARDGVFNVKGWGSTNEISNANLLSRVETNVTLFRPQLIFQNFSLSRFNFFSGFCLIEFLDFLRKLFVFFLQFSLTVIDGCTHVGIVQRTCILHMDFSVGGDFSFLDERIDQLANFVEGAHRHGIAHSIGAGTSQQAYTVLIGASIWIGFNHGRMVECVQLFLADSKFVAQQRFDAKFKRGALFPFFVSGYFCHFSNSADDVVTLCVIVPNLFSEQVRKFTHEHRMTVEHSHAEEGKNVANGFEGEGRIVLTQSNLGKFFCLLFTELKVVDAIFFQFFFAVKEVQDVPHVGHHFFHSFERSVLVLIQIKCFCNGMLPVFAKDLLELSDGGTTRNTL